MKNTRFLDRREFTAQTVLAALSGVAILVSETACGGSSYSGPTSPGTPSPPPTGGSSSDKAGSISSNHGHAAVVTAAQLTGGNQVQLDIRGTADHTHAVTLSADALQKVMAGEAVSTQSTSTGGHDHTVTFNPASPDPGSGY